MRIILKILGLAMILTAVLAVSITGAVFAASGDNGNGYPQNQGAVCPCDECSCTEYVCGDCEPINNSYGYNYLYLTPAYGDR